MQRGEGCAQDELIVPTPDAQGTRGVDVTRLAAEEEVAGKRPGSWASPLRPSTWTPPCTAPMYCTRT